MFLPVDPTLINAQFLLFTSAHPNDGQFLSYRDLDTIKNSNFDKSLPLKVIVHGFTNNLSWPWLYDLKDALLTVIYSDLIFQVLRFLSLKHLI